MQQVISSSLVASGVPVRLPASAYALLLVLADAVAIAAAVTLAEWLLAASGIVHGAGPLAAAPGLPAALGFAYVLLYRLLGPALPWDPQRHNERAVRALGGLLVCAAVLNFVVGQQLVPALVALSAWAAFAFAALALSLQLAGRGLARVASPVRERRPAVIVGSGESALHLVQHAGFAAEFSFVGFFDDRANRLGPLAERLPHLGSVTSLIEYVVDHEMLDVFIALPWVAGGRIRGLLERLRFLPITVYLVPDQMPPLAVEHADAEPTLLSPVLMRPPITAVGGSVKAALDRVVAAVMLALLGPLLLAVALLIKLDSTGPVFFRQKRSGHFGRHFLIWKFRTLKAAQADPEAEKLVTAGDGRVTRVGKWLRKYSIDELPQLINVLLGEMSLVGPRPHAPKAKADGRIYREILSDYTLRYRVKPGMTGWAQVNGMRGETDTEDKLRSRVQYDFFYIRHWSLALDFWILLRTLPAMLAPPRNNA